VFQDKALEDGVDVDLSLEHPRFTNLSKGGKRRKEDYCTLLYDSKTFMHLRGVTVKASNVGPHGNFEPFLARSAPSVGESCIKVALSQRR
jgi:hypothetical protein